MTVTTKKDPKDFKYLLIDGDVLAYTVAAACQHTVEDQHGMIQPFFRRPEAEGMLRDRIRGLASMFHPEALAKLVISHGDNWRHDIAPSYKGNRDPAARPLGLSAVRTMLGTLVPGVAPVVEPRLEADDLIGILAGQMHERGFEHKTLVIGRDKDFKQIPGWHFTFGNLTSSGSPVLTHVTPEAAAKYHLIQTLSGDRVDGYAGCPGLGVERATAIIEEGLEVIPKPGVITRGANKGQTVTKWVSQYCDDPWRVVVSQYQKAGLTEEHALQQARLANILQLDQFDFNTKEIALWQPPGRTRTEKL